MVVTRMFLDGQTNGRTMAVGASVTWMHCSVLFEVTWDKTVCVRADIGPFARTPPSPLPPSPPPPLWTLSAVRADAGLRPRGCEKK
jgi:hypothetical protein